VTGAARGLGRACATALAEAGADPSLLDVLPMDDACAEVEALGRRCGRQSVDLRGLTPERAADVVSACVETLGRLDVLVNCAGVIRRSPALDYSPEDWDVVVSVDLSAAFFLSQAAGRYFADRGGGGKIINIASMLSFQGGVHVPAYVAAKSGLAGFTRALANEWAAIGVNVNAVAPGYMDTDLTAVLREDPIVAEQTLARIPAGRWGRPSDIAGALLLLASDAGEYIHGAIVPVDGGWLAR